MRQRVLLASIATLLVSGVCFYKLTAEPPKSATPSGDPFPDLVEAIKETPGCLGVETADTASGKGVIFAWFEDKNAALKWYYHPVHKELMSRYFPYSKNSKRKPMADIPDDCGPIMAIASITLTGEPTADKLPVKQIAIELYQPLPGGLSIGGKFTPSGVKVKKHMQKNLADK